MYSVHFSVEILMFYLKYMKIGSISRSLICHLNISNEVTHLTRVFSWFALEIDLYSLRVNINWCDFLVFDLAYLRVEISFMLAWSNKCMKYWIGTHQLYSRKLHQTNDFLNLLVSSWEAKILNKFERMKFPTTCACVCWYHLSIEIHNIYSQTKWKSSFSSHFQQQE